jgi:hypothetical protein
MRTNADKCGHLNEFLVKILTNQKQTLKRTRKHEAWIKTENRPNSREIKKGCKAHFKHMSGTCQAHVKLIGSLTCALQLREMWIIQEEYLLMDK